MRILSTKYLTSTIVSTSTGSVQALAKQSPLLSSSSFDLPALSIIDVLSMDSTVAIAFFYRRIRGTLTKKKEKDKREEVLDETSKKDSLRNSVEEERKEK